MNHTLGWTLDVIMMIYKGLCFCVYKRMMRNQTKLVRGHLTHGLCLTVSEKPFDFKS